MSKLSELLAAAKAKAESTANHLPANQTPIATTIQSIGETEHYGIGKHGESIVYNKEQWEFIQLVTSRNSGILIGAAGTGKTTTTRGAIAQLLKDNYIPPIADAHKHLPSNTPGIVAVSYTRRAVMNLKQAMPPELQDNCITIHKLLEYQPTFYEVYDETSGEYKKTMRFEPNRNAINKLPATIKTIIIDESSMVSVDLYHQIHVALPDPSAVQIIFLGDINQLPPVFGSAILGFKGLKLQTVELTTVYRQALESPIIRLAHRILSGNPIPRSKLESPEWNVQGKIKLHPWKKKISADSALLTIAAFFKQAYSAGHYIPEFDMILIPFNKACGTDELNKHIANHIARSHKKTTHEVIAGFNKHYFTVGEKLLYEKEDATLIDIKRNPTYVGKWPQSPSTTLNYWGNIDADEEESLLELGENSTEEEDVENVDYILEQMANSEIEDRVHEASHILTIRLNDSEREVEVKSASEINSLTMAYALTIHKSQGSEWRKVYCIFHQSHNTMIQRELLYTAVTRAREELYCICEPDTFERGINGQRIKGNTLAEKYEFFKGKLDSDEIPFLTEIL